MWLDQLPVDVCERIFRSLLIEWDPSTYIYDNVAALAGASEKQNEAALLALPPNKVFKLSVDVSNESFSQLIAPKLQSLSLARKVTPADEPMFSAPNLYEVAMDADLSGLNAIAGCSSLRKLGLSIDSEVSWDSLIECLRTLRLTHLWLRFDSYYEPENCPCVPFEGSSSGCNSRLEAILSALPELQKLVVRCNSHARDYSQPITDHLLQVPNINKVVLVSYDPCTQKKYVEKLRDVMVDDYTFDQFETALKVGPLLTHLYGKQLRLGSEGLDQLKTCKNLKVMSIGLERGAESHLADLVGVLTKLQAMEVFWRIKMTEDDEGLRIRPDYAAFPGAIQRAVAVGKKLIELKICNATLDEVEIEEVLRSLGKRLRNFTLTISFPDMQGLRCLQKCLDCILKYNPSLYKIGVKWQGYECMDPYRAKARHQRPLKQLLRTTRYLYVRNKITSLPYFLVALRGFYHLAFDHYFRPVDSDNESECMEVEYAETVEVAVEN